MPRRLLQAAAALTLAHAASPAISDAPRGEIASATLMHGNGFVAGTATIRMRGKQAVLDLSLSGVPSGMHGIHIHAVGQCDGPGAAFSAAGGHLNPSGAQHGAENPQGHHLGDLPNVFADSAGRIMTTVKLAGSAKEWREALFDADGASLVLHAGPDDYRTDPSGNSGGRIACGVLEKP
ncbi:MAG: superoxide dismutase family protein [Novosphingobium sp.]